ncbi:WD40 repeat domain-containing serine/threonine protein kinase [Cryptosporangium sp. NPDC048952]|uniref:WD40 repeat domain-containing serine/threonine protein kinase n=1 Tax=Cryptosporangium sp. NPDC048952 TaxID=3363961 RepID=UPI00371C9127
MSIERGRIEAALPHYELGAVLGRGGYGVVYTARHRRLGTMRAVKALALAGEHDSTAAGRFLTEAQVMTELDHPHVVRVHEYAEHDSLQLLVMEYLAGGSMAQRLRSAVAPTVLCAWMLATADALHAAHRRGVVHRDIKPDNLLFTGEGVLKVSDFGIAKLLAATAATASAGFLGTPMYIAPEQITGSGIGPPTDVYALGVTLYRGLAGRPPFAPDLGVTGLIYHHLHERPAPLLEAPPSVAAVTLRALEKNPADRPASASEFAEELSAAAARDFGAHWLERTEVPLRLEARAYTTRPLSPTVIESPHQPASGPAGGMHGAAPPPAARPGTEALAADPDARAGGDALGAAVPADARSRAEAPRARTRAETAGRPAALDARAGGGALGVGPGGDGLDARAAGGALGVAGWGDAGSGVDVGGGKAFADVRSGGGAGEARKGAVARRWVVVAGGVAAVLVAGGVGVAVWTNSDGSVAGGPRAGASASAGGSATVTLAGAEPVDAVAFSPDGARLVAGNSVWDSATGKRIGNSWASGETKSVAFDADGARMATGGRDGAILLRSAGTGKVIRRMGVADDWVRSVAFAPNGRWLAAASDDGSARIWDLNNPDAVTLLTATATIVSFFSDGSRLAAAAPNGTVTFHDPATGTRVGPTLGVPGATTLYSMTYNKQGTVLATGDETGNVQLWDPFRGAPIRTIPAHKGRVTSLAFAPDGRSLITAGRDGFVHVWDARTGERTATFGAAGTERTAVAIDPEGRHLAIASADRTVRIHALR